MCRFDFRHMHAALLLNLGLALAEIASRLGDPLDVLLRVYAGVMSGDRERANAIIERALEASAPAPLRVVSGRRPTRRAPRTPIGRPQRSAKRSGRQFEVPREQSGQDVRIGRR
jgi:hypothetical protein